MALFTQKHKDKIAGVLSCFDRVLITGILQRINYTKGFSNYLFGKGILKKEFMRSLGKPLKDKIDENATRIARENSLEIEYISSPKAFRKEERIQQIISQRGEHPGLVHIFKVKETCPCYAGRHNKETGKYELYARTGMCLHYYFYFIDPELGLCSFRVPTWIPLRVQFYCNAHNYVANKLRELGVEFTQLDNTFAKIDDFEAAQTIADRFSVGLLEPILERCASIYCPAAAELGLDYWWSLTQLEYATDITFHSQGDLAAIYDTLVRTAIHSVKPGDVATFLCHRITYNFEQEVGNDFHTRVEGTRIKHHLGSAAIKMYDKHKIVLRIETTVNDVSFFSHRREVQRQDGTVDVAIAPVKKTIYSLGVMRELMCAANRRYLRFISELADPSPGIEELRKLSESVRVFGRTYRGFNVFDGDDLDLFQALAHGELNITGFRNSTLRAILKDKAGPQVSRMLKRLHLHGLIKRVAHTYKYHLSQLGRKVVLTALKLRELVVIPSMHNFSPPDLSHCAHFALNFGRNGVLVLSDRRCHRHAET